MPRYGELYEILLKSARMQRRILKAQKRTAEAVRELIAGMPATGQLKEFAYRLRIATDKLDEAERSASFAEGGPTAPAVKPDRRAFEVSEMANPVLGQLQAEIERTETVIEGAVTLINGINDRIKQAVTQALSNGATSDELAPFADLTTKLGADADNLAAAVQANTPAAPDNPTPPADGGTVSSKKPRM